MHPLYRCTFVHLVYSVVEANESQVAMSEQLRPGLFSSLPARCVDVTRSLLQFYCFVIVHVWGFV